MSKESGVWGHSSEVGGKAYLIICSNKSVADVETRLGYAKVGFKRVQGCFQGITENAWVVNYEEFAKADVQEQVGDLIADQASVLHLGDADARDRRPATLLSDSPNGKFLVITYLGMFQSVTKEEALAQDAWTYDHSINTWFICKR